MTYWDQVLQEVLNKNNPQYRFRFTNLGERFSKHTVKNSQPRRKASTKQYSLGSLYPDVMFSKREAECILHIIKGKSFSQVAEKLGISPRTVEYYVNNMKMKLDCKAKSELVEKVVESEFLVNVDFK